ncbi:large ribosomal RNA subunit accumulation protein YCED homolog 1, chloroplastic [Phalaenopsis equestris]|uniref:large ribosomal RNA subunit accumulation protein YCED homolog 1, chloroplastic n=1 Tax=Phalaenopsis equestris TaxID=78828 RepID=UPI0009E53AE8|nr:large ribosomal RNA subunit accumulation protein YCED homolog 1, chloroplastic [Phalaenopsis equestris]
MALFSSPFSYLPSSPQDSSRAITIPHSFNSNAFLLPQSPTISTSSHLAPTILFRSPRNSLNQILTLSLSAASMSSSTKITDFDAAVDELELDEDDLTASPWEGAVVYRRDASVTHVEYSTTLERLGLDKLASGLSRSKASAMGIRLPARMAREATLANETPVLISIDVTRRKRRLKLDGILRTVITLRCNRCAEPATESIFSNFALLLLEDPIEEDQDKINMGVLYGEDDINPATRFNNDEMEDDEKLIDQDDKLYFPCQEKEIDISKHIRDLVHLEITINAICDANCKGLCLKCGENLNKKSCSCSSRKVEQATEYGPLRNLRKQMQQS